MSCTPLRPGVIFSYLIAIGAPRIICLSVRFTWTTRCCGSLYDPVTSNSACSGTSGTTPGLNFIYASHLGSGCSLSAIHGGKSVNTTMSFTPLDGLMMATRSGAIDPGVVLYLQQPERMSVSKVEHLLYHRSGLLGVSGLSADRPKLLARANQKSKEAIINFALGSPRSEPPAVRPRSRSLGVHPAVEQIWPGAKGAFLLTKPSSPLLA